MAAAGGGGASSATHGSVIGQPNPLSPVGAPGVALKSACVPSWLLCGPCTWLTVVKEREGLLALHWGKATGAMTQPGFYIVNPCGADMRKVSTKTKVIDLPNIKCLDAKGAPIIVSGVITYYVEDLLRAALDVTDIRGYIKAQGQAIMKQICAEYPYYSPDPSEPSLKSEAQHLSDQLKSELQSRSAVAGVRICDVALTDLYYSNEIAQAMLVRQQAEALVEARQLVVEGAVAIAKDAIEQLELKGVRFSAPEKARLTQNLLVVVAGDSKAVQEQ